MEENIEFSYSIYCGATLRLDGVYCCKLYQLFTRSFVISRRKYSLLSSVYTHMKIAFIKRFKVLSILISIVVLCIRRLTLYSKPKVVKRTSSKYKFE